jgi:hypothetical protein
MTLKVELCPPAITTGRLGDVKEKYWVETETLLTVIDADPEFDALTVRVLLLPADTLPKSRVVAASTRLPICCWLEAPVLTPWHPTNNVRLISINKAVNALAGLALGGEVFLADCVMS